VLDICYHCGLRSEPVTVDAAGPVVACAHCGHRQPFAWLPLFVVTGPSGAGKSTACAHLAPRLGGVVCLEADTLWGHVAAADAGGYSGYWNVWLTMAVAVHQSGRPVALFGTALPEHIEPCAARPLVRAVHYLALVVDDEELERRLRARPAWRGSAEEGVLARTLGFNRWLREHASRTSPPMALLDATGLSVGEVGDRVEGWLRAHR
jgi:hypothetical protein